MNPLPGDRTCLRKQKSKIPCLQRVQMPLDGQVPVLPNTETPVFLESPRDLGSPQADCSRCVQVRPLFTLESGTGSIFLLHRGRFFSFPDKEFSGPPTSALHAHREPDTFETGNGGLCRGLLGLHGKSWAGILTCLLISLLAVVAVPYFPTRWQP